MSENMNVEEMYNENGELVIDTGAVKEFDEGERELTIVSMKLHKSQKGNVCVKTEFVDEEGIEYTEYFTLEHKIGKRRLHQMIRSTGRDIGKNFTLGKQDENGIFTDYVGDTVNAYVALEEDRDGYDEPTIKKFVE